MRIFKKRRRTNGNGRLHHIEEREEILYQTVGQLRFQKIAKNDIIIGIRKSYLIQIVAIHKLVKDIGTEHHCLRNGDTGILKLLKFRMPLHHIVNESQTTAFSTQRAITDTGKIGITVKTVALENGNHSLILHLAVFHNGFKDDPPVSVHILKTVPSDRFKKFGNREHGARIQPTGYMIAGNMIQKRFGRHGKQNIL